jgi:hypothetical protein
MKEDGSGSGDVQMHNADEKAFAAGIPNEDKLPHLHAITHRKNLLINSNRLIKKNEVTVTSL